MKTLRGWLSFAVYLMIWVCVFKLFDLYLKKNDYTDEETTRLCLVGLATLCILYNTDYIKH